MKVTQMTNSEESLYHAKWVITTASKVQIPVGVGV